MSSVGTAYGGSETYIINIAKHLCHDFNIKLILGRGRFTDDFNKLVRNYPIKFLSVPFISRYSRFSTSWRKTKLYKKINDFDIEALTVMASLKKIRRFISDTDILEVQYPTESLILPFIKRHIKKVIHFHGPWSPPIYNHTKKIINRYADDFVTCSQWSKSILKQNIKTRDIKVIYNGVDTTLFKSTIDNAFNVSEQYDPNLLRIGTVGRLSKAKGTDILLKVASEMQGVAEFFVVGPCDEDFFSYLKNYKTSNFHLLGPKPNKDLPVFYNFIDCFVLPSLEETFPISILEAMSCGKPIIASRVGGIPEIIDDGNKGILCEPGDFKSLKENIAKIINEKTLRYNLAKSSRETVIKNFSIEKTKSNLIEFYKTLLNVF